MSWKTTWPGVGLAKAAEAGVSTGGGRLVTAQETAKAANNPVAASLSMGCMLTSGFYRSYNGYRSYGIHES